MALNQPIRSANKIRQGITGEVVVSPAALIELGLDYTTYNVNGTSVGVYARGGALVWGGDRGTSWQVQGGLSFKF